MWAKLSSFQMEAADLIGTPPWQVELEVYKKITRVEYSCALSQNCLDFDAKVLWANPSMVSKYPIMAALARGEFSGVAAEATSERTFSYSGRVFSTPANNDHGKSVRNGRRRILPQACQRR